MHYIGMDCHITTLDFALVNEARRLIKANSVATSVNGFIEFVRTVPPPRTIYKAEGAPSFHSIRFFLNIYRWLKVNIYLYHRIFFLSMQAQIQESSADQI